jgi:hypothetical protein
MSLQTNANIVNLFDDGDDSIPGPSSLTYRAATVSATKRPAMVPAVVPASAKQPAMKKPKKPSKGFALIWVAHNGRGNRSQTWRQKDLRVVGIYSTKASAEEAKERLMEQHEQAGYGDILVGGTWDDEIDLVVRDAPLFFEE